MTKLGLRVALCAMVLPFLAPTAAHADPYLNTCTIAGTGTVNSFTANCTPPSGPSNVDSGTYSFTFTWAVNPCSVPSGPVGGTVTGTGPWGSFNGGSALAVINSGTLHDLNFGFSRASGGAATGRHSAFFRFTCTLGVSSVQSGGQVSQIEAIYAAGAAPNSAYCPYGSINGAATYNPPAGSGGVAQLTMTLTIQCVGPAGSLGAGTYTVTLQGNEFGGCYTGNGIGTISGVGPNGQAVNGAWAYSRNTVHYYGFPPSGTGYVRMGADQHVYGFYLWLDILSGAQNGAAPCPLPGGQIVGHGLVIA